MQRGSIFLYSKQSKARDKRRDNRMDGCYREYMCRGIPLKKASLQEHVRTEWSEAQGMSAFITHTETHTQSEAPLLRFTMLYNISSCTILFIGVCHILWVFLEYNSSYLWSNSLNQPLAPCLNLASWLNHRYLVFSMDTVKASQNTPALWQHAPKVGTKRPGVVWEEFSGYVSWKQTRQESLLIHENHIRLITSCFTSPRYSWCVTGKKRRLWNESWVWQEEESTRLASPRLFPLSGAVPNNVIFLRRSISNEVPANDTRSERKVQRGKIICGEV